MYKRQTFTNYEEEIIGDAPGPSVPEKDTPGSFPEIESEAGIVPPKGDDTDTRMNADVIAEEKAAAEKAAMEKAAAEKAATEAGDNPLRDAVDKVKKAVEE